jgi:hypothetical protein
VVSLGSLVCGFPSVASVGFAYPSLGRAWRTSVVLFYVPVLFVLRPALVALGCRFLKPEWLLRTRSQVLAAALGP